MYINDLWMIQWPSMSFFHDSAFHFIYVFIILFKGSLSAYIPKQACEMHSEPGSVVIGGIFSANLKAQITCSGVYDNEQISNIYDRKYGVRHS